MVLYFGILITEIVLFVICTLSESNYKKAMFVALLCVSIIGTIYSIVFHICSTMLFIVLFALLQLLSLTLSCIGLKKYLSNKSMECCDNKINISKPIKIGSVEASGNQSDFVITILDNQTNKTYKFRSHNGNIISYKLNNMENEQKYEERI